MSNERESSTGPSSRIDLSALAASSTFDEAAHAIAERAARAHIDSTTSGAAVRVARWFVPLAAAVAVVCWSASVLVAARAGDSAAHSHSLALGSRSSDAWLLFAMEPRHD